MRAAGGLVVVAFAACGRIGFDPLGGGATSDGAGPDDGTPGVCAAVEACDGIDDDCDDSVDEGCPCAPFDVTIPAVNGAWRALAWTGADYLSLIDDGTAYRIGAISPTGAFDPRGTIAAVAIGTGLGDQAFAWTGTRLLVAWVTGQRIMLSQFDGQGAALGAAVEVTPSTTASQPAVVWAGDHGAVVWGDDRGGSSLVYMRALDATGAPTGAEFATSLAGGPHSVIPTSGGYLVGVVDAFGMSGVARVGQGGGAGALQVPGGAGASIERYRLARAGAGVAAVWRQIGQSLGFQRFDDAGALVGAVITLPQVDGVDLIAGGVGGTVDGYQIGAVKSGSTPALVQIGLDTAGGITAGPLAVSSVPINGIGDVEVVAVAGRTLLLLPTGIPDQHRVIQRCP